jgi:DNA-binding NtrC family response regulator
MSDRASWITVAAPSAHRMTYQRLRLLVLDGPDVGAHVEFAEEPIRIGGLPSNDLVLTDPRVSGLHCEISVDRRGVHLRDPGSTNGTRVDGVRVSDAYLHRGAEIRLGDTVLRLDPGEGATEVELQPGESFGPLVGASAVMRELYARIRKFAPADTPILVLGETGSGKEMVARAIHELGDRAGEPFVPVECAAMPEGLIESELFGYSRGAFTGADQDFCGAFERAGRGTVLLDEIGDMPLALQPKLLRVIERREVRPLGSGQKRPVRARLIAATNRDLATMVSRGTFRADLYYRLSVGQLHVPPLRERRDDIPLLVEHFLREFPEAGPLDKAMMKALVGHSWPGNVRELHNAVQRIAVLGSPALAEHTAVATGNGIHAPRILVELDLPYKEARDRVLEEFCAVYAREALQRSGGNISEAARRCGVDRMTFYRLMQKGGTE